MSSMLRKQIYAGLLEIVGDDKHYWHSTYSNGSKFTESGIVELSKFMAIMAPHMLRDRDEDLDRRAKALVIKELEK